MSGEQILYVPAAQADERWGAGYYRCVGSEPGNEWHERRWIGPFVSAEEAKNAKADNGLSAAL